MIKKEDVPQPIYWRAVRMTRKVDFLTREEKESYAAALIEAMLWAKSVEQPKQ